MNTYTKTTWGSGDLITAEKMNNIENQMYDATNELINLRAAIEYVDMKINSFSASPNPTEPGSSGKEITLTWSRNKVPASIVLKAGSNTISGVATSDTSKTYTVPAPNAATTTGWTTTFTLTMTDAGSTAGGKSPTSDTKTLNFNFSSKVYYGVSTNSSLTAAQAKALGNNWSATTSRAKSGVTINATGSNRIWFAFPARLGTPVFRAGSESAPPGGFTHQSGTVSIENDDGFTETYNLYYSNQTGLGSTVIYIS